MLIKLEFDIELLKYNDKLTRFCTGIPTYDSFIALVEYLEPKAKEKRMWKGSSMKPEEKQHGSQCFSHLSTGNQLFSVLIQP